MPDTPPPTPAEPFVRLGEAARQIGVSVSTLRRWIDDGNVTAQRTLGGQRVLLKSEVERVDRLVRDGSQL